MAANHSLTSVNTEMVLIFSNKFVNNTATEQLSGVSQAAGTALNAVSSIIGVPVKLQGLTSDNPLAFSQQEVVETVTSMDGNLYGGFLASAGIIEVDVTFIAGSESLQTLQQIVNVMKLQRETMVVSGTMHIPSLQETYTLDNGYLINYKTIPTHGRILENIPVKFRFSSAQLSASIQ